jgi:rubrerythrin
MPVRPIHPQLRRLVLMAYSAERAAAFAYQGHAAATRDAQERARIADIEREEWEHRAAMRTLLDRLGITPSAWLEWRFWIIGTTISALCHVIGRFQACYFAGRLESANVNEYLVMARLAKGTAIADAIPAMLAMAQVEKDHEAFFLQAIHRHGLMPWFRAVFRWGPGLSFNALTASAVEAQAAGAAEVVAAS